MPLFDPLSPMLPLKTCGLLWGIWLFYWVASAQFTLKQKKREGIARIQHTIPTFIGVFSVFHQTWEHPLFGQAIAAIPVKWLGVAIVAAGHTFAFWARIHLGKYWSGTVALKEGHKIISTGPYGMVRHPIYTGLLSAILGSAVAAGGLDGFIGFAIMIPAYIIKWKREEKLLIGEFGQEYRDYMKKTPAIVPFVILC